MALNLISQSLGQNSVLNFIYQSRLDQYISIYQKDLLALSYFHEDKPLVTESLKYFSDNHSSPLADLVSNEIFFDLFISFKKDDYRFKGSRELEKIITLTYAKYAQFIRVKIASFYKDLSKLRTKLKKEKWKIKKIKRVPQLTDPIKITLDICLDYIAYKKFKRLANNERSPLNIGRHAPKKDTLLSFIDVKNLISEPKSKLVFEESTHVCRDLINIFIHYLKAESCKKTVNT